jgi:hypothetical protein
MSNNNESPKRVYLFDEVQDMTPAAQDALFAAMTKAFVFEHDWVTISIPLPTPPDAPLTCEPKLSDKW